MGNPRRAVRVRSCRRSSSDTWRCETHNAAITSFRDNPGAPVPRDSAQEKLHAVPVSSPHSVNCAGASGMRHQPHRDGADGPSDQRTAGRGLGCRCCASVQAVANRPVHARGCQDPSSRVRSPCVAQSRFEAAVRLLMSVVAIGRGSRCRASKRTRHCGRGCRGPWPAPRTEVRWAVPRSHPFHALRSYGRVQKLWACSNLFT